MKKRIFIAAMLLSFTFLSPLSATTVVRKSLRQLIRASKTIVYGTCSHVETQTQGKFVFNVYTILVHQVLKGEDSLEEIKFRQIKSMGGAPVGRIAALPRFKPGEEFFLFLSEPGRSGYPLVVGAYQGKFLIHTDPKTKRKYVIDHTQDPPRRVDAEKFGRAIYNYAHR